MKYILIIPFFFFGGLLKSQDAVVLPPFGHTAFATDFDISADSKTIASVGLDGHLLFWDIETQKAFQKIAAHLLESYSVRYSWNGDYVVTSSIDMTVKVWDKKGKLLHEINTGSPNLFAELDRTEKKLVVASYDGHARVYEFPSLKLLFDIETGSSKLNFAVFSTNSRLVFTGDDAGVLNAYDIENSGKSLLNLKLESPVKMVSFDWAGSAMIIHTMNGMGEILLLPSFQSIGRLPIPTVDYKSGAAQFVSNMDISPNSQWLAFGNTNGQVQMVSGEKLVAAASSGVPFETTAIPTTHTDFIGKVKFSPDMRFLVSLGHDKKFSVIEINGVDIEKIQEQYVSIKIIKQYSDYIRSIFFDTDKNIHMRGFFTYSWDLKTGEHYTEHIVDTRDKFLREELNFSTYEKLTFYVDQNRDIVLIDKAGKLLDPDKIFWSKRRSKAVITFEGKAYIYDVNTQSVIAGYSESWKEKPDVAGVSESGEFLLAEKNVLTCYDTKGKRKWNYKNEANIYSVDISKGGLVAIGNYGLSLPVINLSDGKEKSSITMNEAEAQVVCFLPDEDLIVYSGYYGSLQMVSISTKTKTMVDFNTDNSVFAMAVSDDGKMIATIGYDRLIRLYSVEYKKSLFDIFTMQESGMAIVNEDNYYMSDKKAYQELAFMYKDKIYTGDQFDAKYNRPDIVLTSSPYADPSYVGLLTDTWKKRMKRLGLKTDEILESKTEISLVNGSEIKTNTKDKEILLEIAVTDSVNNVNQLVVTVNDVPLYGNEGMKISHSATEKKSTVSVKVPLLPEKNVIKISGVDAKGSLSLPEVVEVNSHSEDTPQLFLVTLGTSKYKDERFNLNYAAKDATDVNDLFKEGKHFSKVNSLVLTDDKVTPACLPEIKSFLQKAAPTDVVMVFIAGHGVLDANYNYYLAGHTTNFDNPSEGGVKYEDVEKIFEEVAAIRKTLLLDACHSGELDRDEVAMATTQNTKNDKVKFRSSGAGILTSEANKKTSLLVKELFADMRSGSGATVLSSAGGAEYAIESAEYKNGLFTYSMIDGLKNGKADLDGDGKIMLSELQQFVSNSVLQLSGGEQKPTSRVENLSMDFQVW